eukprot:5382383-Prymnesium_polylepis.1
MFIPIIRYSGAVKITRKNSCCVWAAVKVRLKKFLGRYAAIKTHVKAQISSETPSSILALAVAHTATQTRREVQASMGVGQLIQTCSLPPSLARNAESLSQTEAYFLRAYALARAKAAQPWRFSVRRGLGRSIGSRLAPVCLAVRVYFPQSRLLLSVTRMCVKLCECPRPPRPDCVPTVSRPDRVSTVSRAC